LGNDCGLIAAEGDIMKGRETAKKYNEFAEASRLWGEQEIECKEALAAAGLMYRFSTADIPISCRDSDWVLKLGPPLG
jgi:hypothetical protein